MYYDLKIGTLCMMSQHEIVLLHVFVWMCTHDMVHIPFFSFVTGSVSVH